MSDHRGHTVQWTTWEGMTYRLYCHTCQRYTQIFQQAVKSLMRFIW